LLDTRPALSEQVRDGRRHLLRPPATASSAYRSTPTPC